MIYLIYTFIGFIVISTVLCVASGVIIALSLVGITLYSFFIDMIYSYDLITMHDSYYILIMFLTIFIIISVLIVSYFVGRKVITVMKIGSKYL